MTFEYHSRNTEILFEFCFLLAENNDFEKYFAPNLFYRHRIWILLNARSRKNKSNPITASNRDNSLKFVIWNYFNNEILKYLYF